MQSWLFPFGRKIERQKSAIAALKPLVFYAQKDMKRTYWKNTGSLGAEYDLDTVWGAAGGGTIVSNAVVGDMYKIDNGAAVLSGLETGSYATVIAQEATIAMVHFNNGPMGVRFLYGGRLAASPYCYMDNTPAYNGNAGVLLTGPVTQAQNVVPQWMLHKVNGANSKIKSRFGAQVTGNEGANNIAGVTLGSTNAHAGASTVSEFATLFIVQGKSLLEIEAAIVKDFPGLA